MRNTRTVSPTGSYWIDLPSDVEEEKDERVASYWKPGSEVLVQTSSYLRDEGQQVCSSDRLKARLAREALSEIREENISIPSCPDCAAASGIDTDGYRWLYCYAVWPDLTILITISGRPQELKEQDKWALDALRSLRRPGNRDV